MATTNFNVDRARKNGNLAKALVWLGKDEDNKSKFRWRNVTIKDGPNEHGQFYVQCISDGWTAVTDTIRNLTDKELATALGFEVSA